jgi:hypothetical protein
VVGLVLMDLGNENTVGAWMDIIEKIFNLFKEICIGKIARKYYDIHGLRSKMDGVSERDKEKIKSYGIATILDPLYFFFELYVEFREKLESPEKLELPLTESDEAVIQEGVRKIELTSEAQEKIAKIFLKMIQDQCQYILNFCTLIAWFDKNPNSTSGEIEKKYSGLNWG